MSEEKTVFDTKFIETKDGTLEEVWSLVPDCCRESWESCTHGAPKLKKEKRQIGL